MPGQLAKRAGGGITSSSQLWAILDPDSDGKITYSEWEAAFKFIDQDNDGCITRKELVLLGGETCMFDSISRRNRCAITFDEWCKTFEVIDTNRSKAISASEWANFIQSAEAEGPRTLRNGLSPAEQKAVRKRAAWAAKPPPEVKPLAGKLVGERAERADRLAAVSGGVVYTYPQGVHTAVERVMMQFSAALRNEAFMSKLMGGRQLADMEIICDLADLFSRSRMDGPPRIVVVGGDECSIYGGKMQVLHAEHKHQGWAPVEFEGAYDRSTKILLLNPSLLQRPVRDMECILVQLFGYYVAQECSAEQDITGDEGLTALSMMTDIKMGADLRSILAHYNEHGFLKRAKATEINNKFIAADFAWGGETLAGQRIVSESKVVVPNGGRDNQAAREGSPERGAGMRRSPPAGVPRKSTVKWQS